MIDCLRSISLVKSRGLTHLVAVGLVSMMLDYVTAKTVISVGPMGRDAQNKLLWRDKTCPAHS